jgi:predicted  nucleic acid-binding Zn-ribbon protein
MQYLLSLKMKKTNPINENDDLRRDLDYEKKRRKKTEKRLREVLKENDELKKNLKYS